VNTPDSVPFPTVIGQIEPRKLLARVIRSEHLAHAYLFIGPEGSGKRALAIELARVLNCPQGVEVALNGCQCHSCVSMLRWRHPNLHTIFPLPKIDKDKKNPFEDSDKVHDDIRHKLATSPYAPLFFTGTGQILIGHIREVRDIVSRTMDISGIRVIITHPADALREEAANAFLKLLEEPPDKCLLILTAESTRDVLPTILSRCQQVHFVPLSSNTIYDALISRQSIETERARLIASLANGSYTHALELLEHSADEMTTDGLDFLRSVAVGNVGKIVESIEKWLANDATRSEIKDRIDITSLWLQDALTTLGQASDGKQLAMRIPNSGSSVSKMAEKYGATRLIEALTELEEAKLAIDANALQSLVLTVLAIKLKRIFLS